MSKPQPEPKEEALTEEQIEKMKASGQIVGPDQMMQMLQNKMILIKGNADKEEQRILDQLFNIFGRYNTLNQTLSTEIKSTKEEITRLQKLCKLHHIDSTPPKKSKPKNRKERRQAEREAKKAAKKSKKRKK